MDQLSGTSPSDAEGQAGQPDPGPAVSDPGTSAPGSATADGVSELGGASVASAGASDRPAGTGDAGGEPAGAESADRREVERPGFGARGRARRRLRFLRKARELAYRDLGGLVFNLHRFGQRNDALVLAKLGALGKIDSELRALERALQEREPVTVLREAGITACPRCAAIHGSEDRFCPNCGLSMARHVDLPIAGSALATPAPGTTAPAPIQPAASPPAPVAPGAEQAAPAPAPSATTAPFPAVERGGDGGTGRSERPDEPTEILRPGAPRS